MNNGGLLLGFDTSDIVMQELAHYKATQVVSQAGLINKEN